MNRRWMAPGIALMLAAVLTSCGADKGNAGISASGGSGSMSGSISQSQDNVGNVPNGTDNSTKGDRTPDNNVKMGRMTQRRTAYDFLKDGKYSANRKGEVNGRGDPYARDFTQGARDLVKDAGDAVGDMGREIGGAVKNTGKGIGQSVRGMMSR